MRRLIQLFTLLLGVVVGIAVVRLIAQQLHAPLPDTLLDALGNPFTPTDPELISTTAGLGLLLLGAWLSGLIFRRLHLPMITGYLLFGVLVGPSLHTYLPDGWPNLLPAKELDYLSLINALAISIIAFTAGGEIRIDALRTGLRHITSITLSGVLLMSAGVCTLLMLLRGWIPLLNEQEPIVGWIICMIIGTIAIANSPATVLALIKETGATGTMAQISLAVTVCKDLVLVILFTILMAVLLRLVPGTGETTGSDSGAAAIAGKLAVHLLGSIGAGVAAGVLFRLVTRHVAAHMAVFVIGAAFALALLSDAMHLEPLLVALTAGFALANLWPKTSKRMFDATEELSLPVYCIFFAVAGAMIELKYLVELWPLALLIVGLRGALLWITTWLGAATTRLEKPARSWVWMAFVAQAGVSIALVTQVRETFAGHEWAEKVTSLLFAVIAIHQVAGPLLMRFGLVRAGEIEP